MSLHVIVSPDMESTIQKKLLNGFLVYKGANLLSGLAERRTKSNEWGG